MIRNFQIKQGGASAGIFLAFGALFILLTLLQSSCSPEAVDTPRPVDTGLFKTYVQEPVTLDQKINRSEINVAEQLEIRLEAAVPEDMDVTFPAYSAGLGDFTLKEARRQAARMTGAGNDARVVHAISYILEPYLPGTYSIPAMTVIFADKNDTAEDIQLVTAPLQIMVNSLLPQDDSSAEIKDIKGPFSMPENTGLQILLVVTLLFLIVLGAAGFFYWKKHAGRKEPDPVLLRPEEIALQELDRLLLENLLSRGEIKLFHLRISDILRRYIENRFGIRAPERTTEEFLTELSRAKSQDKSLLGRHKSLLADFLTQSDLVKFAKHEPTIAESEKTVQICRKFIEETKEPGSEESRFQGFEGKNAKKF